MARAKEQEVRKLQVGYTLPAWLVRAVKVEAAQRDMFAGEVIAEKLAKHYKRPEPSTKPETR